ncbi:MAG: NB-ARC domain-containing protein [Gammaproteobacteria bacterium]
MTYVFVSYARDDDEPFVERLYADLVEQGVRVWWDREAMESRGRTFLQEIRDALSDVERVILVVGPRAIASDYVAVEWGHALQQCKVVIPILRVGAETTVPLGLRKTDFTLVPAPLRQFHVPDFRDDARYPEALADLVRILSAPIGTLGELQGVDPLPAHFEARESYLERLRGSVLADTLQPIVTEPTDRVTLLQGMGGAGKSVIAAAFARGCETRRAFYDGIAWTRVGPAPASVDDDALSMRILRRLATSLGVTAPTAVELIAVIAEMAASLQERRCLIVLDDVWSSRPVAAVAAAAGPYCRVLATTRDASVAVDLGAVAHAVEVLEEDEALQLLARWIGDSSAALPQIARELVRECGYLALAIAMVGATLRGRPQDRWADMLARLRQADIAKIRRDFPHYPYPDLLRAIGVSVDALEPAARDRYLELAVFADGALIPESIMEKLWAPMAAADVRDLVDLWVDRSLARRMGGGLRLHDLQRDYVVNRRSPLEPLHRQLVEALRGSAPGGWSSLGHQTPGDQYVFERLPWHLQQARLDPELDSLLSDPAWLEAKLRATDASALIGDFSLVPSSTLATKLADSVRLSMHALARNPAELTAQLLGRITPEGNADVAAFRSKLAAAVPANSLAPLSPTLTGAGGPLLRTLGPFESDIEQIAVSADFSLAALKLFSFGENYSRHCKVRLWDLSALRELRSFDAYDNLMAALTLSSDGSTVVTSGDDIGKGSSLRLWDTATGTLRREIACEGSMSEMHPLPGRHQILCDDADGVAVLDLQTGAFQAKHVVEPVRSGGCVPLPDGRHAVVADWQGGLRLLEIGTWREIWRSAGHAHYGTPMALSASGAELAVAGAEHVVDILDVRTGRKLRRLEGRNYPITALAMVADTVVVGMNDGAVELRGSGIPVTYYEHENRVTAILVSPDARQVVTAANDKTLKIWDVARLNVPPAVRPHTHTVMQVAFTPNGKTALSVAGDGLCILWDPQKALSRTTIKLEGWVQDMAVLDDTHALICSSDTTLRTLDLKKGKVLAVEHARRDDSYQALTLVNGGRQAVAAFHIDDGQEQTYGLTLWNVAPLKSLHAAIDGGVSRPVHGYRLAWSEELQLGITPDHRGTGLWRVDKERPMLVDTIPCGGSEHATAIPGTRRVAVVTTDALEVWALDPIALIQRTPVPAAHRVAASVSPSFLVVGSRDGAVRLLKSETLETVAQFTIDAAISACAVSRDARVVMIGDDNGRVHFLRVHSDWLAASAPATSAPSAEKTRRRSSAKARPH